MSGERPPGGAVAPPLKLGDPASASQPAWQLIFELNLRGLSSPPSVMSLFYNIPSYSTSLSSLQAHRGGVSSSLMINRTWLICYMCVFVCKHTLISWDVLMEMGQLGISQAYNVVFLNQGRLQRTRLLCISLHSSFTSLLSYFPLISSLSPRFCALSAERETPYPSFPFDDSALPLVFLCVCGRKERGRWLDAAVPRINGVNLRWRCCRCWWPHRGNVMSSK